MCCVSQRLTWAVLKAAGTPRRKKHVARDTGFNTDNYKDRVNTLLLVATLVKLESGEREGIPSVCCVRHYCCCSSNMGDLTLVLNAFTAGVFVAVSKLRWLSITILAMAISSFPCALLLLQPIPYYDIYLTTHSASGCCFPLLLTPPFLLQQIAFTYLFVVALYL